MRTLLSALRALTVAVFVLAVAVRSESAAAADQAPFDLRGPTVSVHVTRAGETLPLANVPTLAAHDRLTLVATVPDAKTTQYLMVAAFLRGPTDPPPEQWFYRCDTWKPPCDREGLSVDVPDGAQQMVVFFAPKTGGDYRTLVDAVRGKPGAFVRAAQQLRQASLDRARLDRYLALLQDLATHAPGELKTEAPRLAHSLAIKFDEKCLDRIPALQAPCLMQNSDGLILSDGHGESLVSMVTTGIGRDLALHAGETSLFGSGSYSSVIGSILDVGRLMDSLRTAQYVYIPALPSVVDDRATLMLNTPPSFHKPLSVLVAALPAVERTVPPSLRTATDDAGHCTADTPLVLPVEGDALVYTTRYAHDVRLEGTAADGTAFSLPAQADPLLGGYVVTGAAATPVSEDVPVRLAGRWGFDRFEGPNFRLATPRAREWRVDDAVRDRVVAGRESILTVQGTGACLDTVTFTDPAGRVHETSHAVAAADRVEVTLPLEGVHAGALALHFSDRGGVAAAPLTVTAFEEPSRLDTLRAYVGDSSLTVDGQGLDQLAAIEVAGSEFVAGDEVSPDSRQVQLTGRGEQGPRWVAGTTLKGTARLHDGRTLPVTVTVRPPRPRLKRLALNVRGTADPDGLPLALGDPTDLPVRSTVTFAVQTEAPSRFLASVRLEVDAPESDVSTTLDVKGGALTLLDPRTVVATVDVARLLGPTTFGLLRYRLLNGEDASDWLPLGRLVRLPALRAPQCSPTDGLPCTLPGGRLFLLGSVAARADERDAMALEPGFPGDAVLIPHPLDGHLYLRLRDDPDHLAIAELPTGP